MSNPFQKFSEFVLPLDLGRNATDPRRAGAPIRAVRELMKDAWIYWTALAIAYFGMAVASLSLVSEHVRDELVLALSAVETVTVALLFFRCMFDSRFRSGFATANRQIIANQRRTKGLRLFDPYWGMFSPYNGPLLCRAISPLLLVETLLVASLGGKGWGDIVYLLFTCFFVVTELVLLYVGLNTEPDNGLW
jgi:hypothetical protein